jgi:hypothetical protein
VLRARKGSEKLPPPGRDVKQMVLTYGCGGEPVQREVTSCTEAPRRCSASSRGLLKPCRIAAVTLALLLLLAGAIATAVSLRPAAVTTDLNKPTQTQRATLGREPVRPEIENGLPRQANGVVTPEAGNALQAPRWSGPVTFRGEIAHGLNIEMKLVREGSKLSGSYAYERIGNAILVKGTIDETGSIVLEEFVKGQKTGIFTGKVVSDARVEGIWSKPGSTRSRDFFLVGTGLLRSMPASHDQGRKGQQ